MDANTEGPTEEQGVWLEHEIKFYGSPAVLRAAGRRMALEKIKTI